MFRKYKVVNKFRFITFLTILTLTLSLIINLAFLSNRVFGSNSKYKMVFIEENDTLWDIAKNNNFQNKDVRVVVNEIRVINNLGYKYIQPGDLIKVPTN